MIMFNQELRFPFAQKLEMNFKSGSIWLAPIRGAIFLDLGNAWEQEFPGFLSLRGKSSFTISESDYCNSSQLGNMF